MLQKKSEEDPGKKPFDESVPPEEKSITIDINKTYKFDGKMVLHARGEKGVSNKGIVSATLEGTVKTLKPEISSPTVDWGFEIIPGSQKAPPGGKLHYKVRIQNNSNNNSNNNKYHLYFKGRPIISWSSPLGSNAQWIWELPDTTYAVAPSTTWSHPLGYLHLSPTAQPGWTVTGEAKYTPYVYKNVPVANPKSTSFTGTVDRHPHWDMHIINSSRSIYSSNRPQKESFSFWVNNPSTLSLKLPTPEINFNYSTFPRDKYLWTAKAGDIIIPPTSSQGVTRPYLDVNILPFSSDLEGRYILGQVTQQGYYLANGQEIDAGKRYDNFNITVVPEPCTMLLMGSGLAGLAGIARRRRRQQ
jgi:hypothetical protein